MIKTSKMGGKDRDVSFTTMQVETVREETQDHYDTYVYRRQVQKLLVGCFVFGVLALMLIWLKMDLKHAALSTSFNKTAIDTKNPLNKIEPVGDSDIERDVLAALDPDVEPCTDFYQFACGGWLKQTAIPKDKPSISRSFTATNEHNRKVMASILRQKWPILHEFHASCMDIDAAERQKTTPIQPLLDKISQTQTKTEFFHLAGQISRTGPNFLTSVGVAADSQDVRVNALYLSQGGFTLPDRDYYLNASLVQTFSKDYLKYIATLFKETGVAQDKADEYSNIVLNFETQVAEICLPLEELRDPVKNYNLRTAAQLNAISPLLFTAFLKGAQIPVLHNLRGKPIKIIMETPSFFTKAQALIKKTPLKTLQIVLRYHMIHVFSATLHKALRDANFEFFGKKLSGRQQQPPRWKICVDSTERYLGELAGRYYVLYAFRGNSSALAMELVEGLEANLKQRIVGSTWMDETTRTKALDKLKMVSNLIGHPEKYSAYPILLNASEYYENKVQLMELHHIRAIKRLGNPVDRTRWFMPSSAVNAYYSPTRNQVVFPAGILQSLFFHAQFPASLNYGGIGMIIGHELTHGYDDMGRKFDGDGNLNPWWSNTTRREFDKRAQCLVKQYSKFQVTDPESKKVIGKINGKLTLGENIADNGGLKIAFQAYRQQSAAQRTISIGSFTSEQQFFIAFAQLWCSKSTPQHAQSRLLTDVHSPSQWRTNGPVMNNKDFAKAFQCPANAPMNPSSKCDLW